MRRTLLCLSLAALAAPALAQFTLVAPNGFANTVGNSNNTFPWNRATASMRIQQVYDSSNFTAQSVTFPVIIQGLKFRPYAGAVTSWTGGTWPNVRIDMATCPVDFLAVSTTFANNLGGNLTTVVNGPVTVTPGSTLGVGVVVPWHVNIPLTTPFIYDPAAGDLTLDVYLDGTGWVGGSRAADVVSGAAAPNQALGSRIYNTTGIAATTGTITLNHSLICEFTYVPATGLYPGFVGTPRTGPVGQQVSFTDQSYTSDPGGITSWQWDIDGDSVPDYFTQNCQHTYTTEGFKTVSLTVTSNLFGAQTLTRTNYIAIDPVDADFTFSVQPAYLVLFTDTSTGNPTSWVWDFENDGIPDATVQNPAFVYPGPGQYTCKLTVADAFSTDFVTKTIGIGIVPLPAFGSTFSGNLTRGFWFQSPTRFSIITAKVPDETNNGTQNVAIFRLAAAPPVFSGTATGGLEFFASGQPSASNLPCVVSFDAGEFVGVLGACGTTSMLNSYGTPAGPFASSVLGQPCTLTRFGTQFNINTSGPTYNYPYWQEVAGALSRVILGVHPCAGLPYGVGTPSGAGPAAPTMRCTALPYVGATSNLAVTQNDTGVLMFMVAGFGRAATPTPFGTALINLMLVTDIMNGAAVVGPGTYNYSFTVPNDPTFVGLSINWQNANLVVATGQVSLSNGVEYWLEVQ